MATLGAIGLTTGVFPSLTLGSGGVGGSITGDNVTTYHLFNVKRLAYELTPPPTAAFSLDAGSQSQTVSAEEIERVVRSVVQEILNQKH
jgi:acetaldehyde dehydrogenase (acetylating)